MTDDSVLPRGFRWGYLSIALGALALAVSAVVIFGGPFAPQQSIGTTIGEVAGDMRAAALRSLRGEPQPAAVPRGWDIDRILFLAAPLIGVAAVVAAAVSALSRDPWRLPTYGAVLGASAIALQFLWWVAMLIAGVVLLVAIVENIGGILGE